MDNFKCHTCKKDCENVWLFGGFGIMSVDKHEYCLPCFNKRLRHFGLPEQPEEELIKPEVEENSHVA
jgi:hypothetical protein